MYHEGNNKAEADIIGGLLNWLENHLDLPLRLDDMAAKSGYSKWHLQRMFRYTTGQTLGAYARQRRLSRAAVALRVSTLPVLDIALQYHFDSQQTFTRSFKRQFGLTPGAYRRVPNWSPAGLRPPIRLEPAQLPQPSFIKIPVTHLVGVNHIYSSSIEKISRFFHSDARVRFWQQYLGDVKTMPAVLFGLHRLIAPGKNDNQRDIVLSYTTAVRPGRPAGLISESLPITLEGGDYAQFTYTGAAEAFQPFVSTLYDTVLPQLGITRRRGLDIERFYPGQEREPLPDGILHADYLIPVHR